MGVRPKRIIVDADDELMKEVRPVVFDAFCRGAQVASGGRLAAGAFLSMVSFPFTWPIAVARQAVHLLIFFAAWWFVYDSTVRMGIPDDLILTVGLVAIFYRDIHSELTDLTINLAIILSGGRALQWACSGYLSGTGFRQKFVNSRTMERNIGGIVAVMPEPYRSQLDKILDLYAESNRPEKERELRNLIDRYWMENDDDIDQEA